MKARAILVLAIVLCAVGLLFLLRAPRGPSGWDSSRPVASDGQPKGPRPAVPTPLPELRGRPPVPSAPNSEPAGETSSLTADHGAEPSFDESPPGAQVCCTANFWASDADTPPEDLQYSVSVENLQDVSQSPAVQSSSEVRDGRRWVAVSLDFPHGTLCEKPSIDVTVTFRNKVGQSASTTMTIDRN